MRRGVSEYLVPPLGPLQLIAAITALYADPAQPFVGRQIAFCGAKGGAGASTLAHNVAHLIAERMGANTVLVDLDLAFGTAGLDFNQDPLHGIADALSPARSSRPGADGADDGPLRRPPVAVRGAGQPGTRLRYPDRDVRRSRSEDPRLDALRRARPAARLDAVEAAHAGRPRTTSSWWPSRTSPRCATPRTSSTSSAPPGPTMRRRAWC